MVLLAQWHRPAAVGCVRWPSLRWSLAHRLISCMERTGDKMGLERGAWTSRESPSPFCTLRKAQTSPGTQGCQAVMAAALELLQENLLQSCRSCHASWCHFSLHPCLLSSHTAVYMTLLITNVFLQSPNKLNIRNIVATTFSC